MQVKYILCLLPMAEIMLHRDDYTFPGANHSFWDTVVKINVPAYEIILNAMHTHTTTTPPPSPLTPTNEQWPEVEMGPIQGDIWIPTLTNHQEWQGKRMFRNDKLPEWLHKLQAGGGELKYDLERQRLKVKHTYSYGSSASDLEQMNSL